MQSKTTQNIFSAAALLIVFALFLPSSLSFIHSTQNHDHIDRCEITVDTHMHEKTLDCDFDDIVLLKLGVYAFAKAELTPLPIYPSPVYNYNPWIGSGPLLTETSRGPPAC